MVQKHHSEEGVNRIYSNFEGGQVYSSYNLGGEGLDHCSRFRGLDVRFEYFRGSQGFVAWPLYTRLRDFPLWVFLKPSLTNSLGVIINRF